MITDNNKRIKEEINAAVDREDTKTLQDLLDGFYCEMPDISADEFSKNILKAYKEEKRMKKKSLYSTNTTMKTSKPFQKLVKKNSQKPLNFMKNIEVWV